MSNRPSQNSSAPDRRRNGLLVALACLLLLFAVYRFASLAMESRHQADLNSRAAFRSPKVVSNFGPKRAGPFEELGLTDAQRQKIDAILRESMPKPPSASDAPSDKPFRVVIPRDKIRAVLTPEQRQKLDAQEKEMRAQAKQLPPGVGGPSPTDDAAQPHIFFRRGP